MEICFIITRGRSVFWDMPSLQSAVGYGHIWSIESGLSQFIYFKDEISAETMEILFVNAMIMNVMFQYWACVRRENNNNPLTAVHYMESDSSIKTDSNNDDSEYWTCIILLSSCYTILQKDGQILKNIHIIFNFMKG